MPELRHHYVAFLDVLGFKEMVKEDLESDDSKHLAKLFKCHQFATRFFVNDADCLITQFSDSIVVATPYAAEKFKPFVESLAQYQRLLLDEGLLCRGGIAVNKHFSNNSFTFSAGLIDAYLLESQLARYPRVVVSQDLLDLVFPKKGKLPKYLMREDDGLIFVNYIGATASSAPKRLRSAVDAVVGAAANNKSASVREKARWLAAYADFTLGTTLAVPRFGR